MYIHANLQATIRFICHSTSLPLELALKDINALKQHQLTSIDALAQTSPSRLQRATGWPSINQSREIILEARRNVASSRRTKHDWVSLNSGSVAQSPVSTHSSLPMASTDLDDVCSFVRKTVSEGELLETTIGVSREPLRTAFTYVLIKHLFPSQGPSSWLSMVEAVQWAQAQRRKENIEGMGNATRNALRTTVYRDNAMFEGPDDKQNLMLVQACVGKKAKGFRTLNVMGVELPVVFAYKDRKLEERKTSERAKEDGDHTPKSSKKASQDENTAQTSNSSGARPVGTKLDQQFCDHATRDNDHREIYQDLGHMMMARKDVDAASTFLERPLTEEQHHDTSFLPRITRYTSQKSDSRSISNEAALQESSSQETPSVTSPPHINRHFYRDVAQRQELRSRTDTGSNGAQMVTGLSAAARDTDKVYDAFNSDVVSNEADLHEISQDNDTATSSVSLSNIDNNTYLSNQRIGSKEFRVFHPIHIPLKHDSRQSSTEKTFQAAPDPVTLLNPFLAPDTKTNEKCTQDYIEYIRDIPPSSFGTNMYPTSPSVLEEFTRNFPPLPSSFGPVGEFPIFSPRKARQRIFSSHEMIMDTMPQTSTVYPTHISYRHTERTQAQTLTHLRREGVSRLMQALDMLFQSWTKDGKHDGWTGLRSKQLEERAWLWYRFCAPERRLGGRIGDAQAEGGKLELRKVLDMRRKEGGGKSASVGSLGLAGLVG